MTDSSPLCKVMEPSAGDFYIDWMCQHQAWTRGLIGVADGIGISCPFLAHDRKPTCFTWKWRPGRQKSLWEILNFKGSMLNFRGVHPMAWFCPSTVRRFDYSGEDHAKVLRVAFAIGQRPAPTGAFVKGWNQLSGFLEVGAIWWNDMVLACQMDVVSLCSICFR